MLNAGQAYNVTLTADGTAPSGGYCEVEGGAAPLYTDSLCPGDRLTFILIPEKDGVYTFTGVWGEYSGKADITEGCTIGQKRADPPENQITVAPTMPATADPTPVSKPAEEETTSLPAESHGGISGQDPEEIPEASETPAKGQEIEQEG